MLENDDIKEFDHRHVRFTYTVFCPCGAGFPVTGLSTGAKQCWKCRKYVRFEVEIDPKTGQRTVYGKGYVAMPPGSAPRDGLPISSAEKGAGRVKSSRATEHACPCGARIPVEPSFSGQTRFCPSCGRAYTVGGAAPTKRETARRGRRGPLELEGKLDRGVWMVTCTCGSTLGIPGKPDGLRQCGSCGAQFKILVPIPPEALKPPARKSPTTRAKAAPPAPAPRKGPVGGHRPGIPDFAKERGLETAQELVLEGGMYQIFCTCGAPNKVDPRSIANIRSCMWCHVPMKVSVVSDPRTGKKIAIVKAL
jgi:hypothetical protein